MTDTSGDRVVLVDEDGRSIGTAPKLAAHEDGQLHRAFSIFLFNHDGDLLLQQRAHGKYHAAGQWSNTCCSHPRPGEEVGEAAHRRLPEEMGVETALTERFAFTYEAAMDNDLVEHEHDHVFTGRFDGAPDPHPAEVTDWRWASLDAVAADATEHPDRYTPWFRIILGRFLPRLTEYAAETAD